MVHPYPVWERHRLGGWRRPVSGRQGPNATGGGGKEVGTGWKKGAGGGGSSISPGGRGSLRFQEIVFTCGAIVYCPQVVRGILLWKGYVPS